MQRILVLATIVCIASSASAAEIALRERATPRQSVVRLDDLADLTGAGANVEHLASTPLMPAPAPGTQHFLRCTELRDLLLARGVDLRNWQFTGADVVTIGEALATPGETTTASSTSDIGPETSTAELLTAAITQYIRQQTGHDRWQVQVDEDDDVLAVQRQAGSRLIIGGGKAPWSGRQRFTLSAGAPEPAITAFARVDRLEMAAVAVRAIERGDFIRRSDVELRPHVGALPAHAITSLDAAVGKEAVQGIRADSLLMANQVRAPIVVHRGERVSVRARAAGITVRTYAVAQQDGSLGDLVTVESLAGKERYAARVSGLRELEIFAAGASANDVAAANAR